MSVSASAPIPERHENVDLARAFYAKKILEKYQKKYEKYLYTESQGTPLGQPTPLSLLSASSIDAKQYAATDVRATVTSWLDGKEENTAAGPPQREDKAPTPFKIGILGAGIAGLYTALMIDSLEDSSVSYEIFEADSRAGGRLYTHHFKGHNENNYYDVGAMRFPRIKPQKRTFDLFKYLELDSKDPKKNRLIPYIMSAPDTDILFFNGVSMTAAEYAASSATDPFYTGTINPKEADAKLNTVLYPFKQALKDDFEKGWAKLMEQDKYSMRGYLSLVENFPDPMINWLETFDDSTASYDRAFTENVMDSLVFDWNNGDDSDLPPVEWFTLQGGSVNLVYNIQKRLKTKPQFNKRVSLLSLDYENLDDEGNPKMLAVIEGEQEARRFDHVISTLPFGAFRMIDSGGCMLPYELQEAISSLQYGPSVKVAILFSSRWWEEQTKNKGGVSRTDRPTRVVVYPSYGIGDEKATTMIVSYTWTQDASRLAAFIDKDKASRTLIDLILNDLADMHNLPIGWLSDQYVDNHAWSWDNSKYAVGAFALYGPGQFETIYPHVTQPVNGVLHFAGEACSVYHAWVVGALDSAYTSLLQLFALRGRQDLVDKLTKLWRGEELPQEDETLALKQVTISQVRLESEKKTGVHAANVAKYTQKASKQQTLKPST